MIPLARRMTNVLPSEPYTANGLERRLVPALTLIALPRWREPHTKLMINIRSRSESCTAHLWEVGTDPPVPYNDLEGTFVHSQNGQIHLEIKGENENPLQRFLFLSPTCEAVIQSVQIVTIANAAGPAHPNQPGPNFIADESLE